MMESKAGVICKSFEELALTFLPKNYVNGFLKKRNSQEEKRTNIVHMRMRKTYERKLEEAKKKKEAAAKEKEVANA